MGTPQPSTTVTYNPPSGVPTSVTYYNPTPTPAPYIPPPITQAEQDKKGEWLDTVLPPSPTGQWGGYPTGSPPPPPPPSPPSAPPPPPPPPAPILPNFKPLASQFDIKQAPLDTIVFDNDSVSIELLTELLYEDVGGVELANMSRYDLIDGQNVSYSAIANLADINSMYNPNNIISSVSPTSSFFSRFQVDLLSRGPYVPYLDADGNLVIEIDDAYDGEVIETQIALSGTIDVVDEQ